MANKFRKLKLENVGLYVAAGLTLLSLLSYTFVHTGDVLSAWIEPSFMGYVAAFGIELGIAGLSLRRTILKSGGVWSTVTLVVLLLVSSFANVYSGFAAKTGEAPSWENVGKIDPLQAAMGILATAMIPLVVFAVGEIVGGDVKKVASSLGSTSKPEVHVHDLKAYVCPCGESFDTAPEIAIHARRCPIWKREKLNGRPKTEEAKQ